MTSVDEVRLAYTRTGHAGADPDPSYRYPVTSHGLMNVAHPRLRDFATAMVSDLQLIDRNHAVSPFFFVGARKRTHWV